MNEAKESNAGVDAIRGLEPEKVSSWLAHNLDSYSTPPYKFDLIAMGGSNLTYKVTDSEGNAFALRRPPEAGVLASAHDMSREWRIMSALEKSSVPVPKCLSYCNDLEILGAEFYVMSFMDGTILRDTETAPDITGESADRATRSLVETQVSMHTLDLEKVGLGDLSKHNDYVGRQLKRWRRQVLSAGVRELPLHDELHQRLEKSNPKETISPGLAHGDYRFDNCVLDESWEVSAVLDWELCTIGNPIADFVWSLQYWADADDKMRWLVDSPTLADSFMSRDEYEALYREASGLDLADIDYYKVFSWWKQASIVEGVYGRLLQGGGGGMSLPSQSTTTGDFAQSSSPADANLDSEPDDSPNSTQSRIHDIARRVENMLEYAADLAQGTLPPV